MKNIGVIGCGVVGSAVADGMSHVFDVLRYDIKKENRNCDSIKELVLKADGPIFICVPTPMDKNGACYTSIVEEIIREINEISRTEEEPPAIVIKSTVVPDTTKNLATKYPYCDICFNPEFLTEKNASEDFKNQDRIIIGGEGIDNQSMTKARQCYTKAYPNVPIYYTSSTIAELVKYTTNIHLAVKVSLANEINQICERLGVSYNTVCQLATMDDRLGKSHWEVPGPDGKRGFGGTCFPKDINALINKAMELDIDPSVMTGAWKKNTEVRR